MSEDVDESARLVLLEAPSAVTFGEFCSALRAVSPGWGIAQEWALWVKYHGALPGWPRTHDVETGRSLRSRSA